MNRIDHWKVEKLLLNVVGQTRLPISTRGIAKWSIIQPQRVRHGAALFAGFIGQDDSNPAFRPQSTDSRVFCAFSLLSQTKGN